MALLDLQGLELPRSGDGGHGGGDGCGSNASLLLCAGGSNLSVTTC